MLGFYSKLFQRVNQFNVKQRIVVPVSEKELSGISIVKLGVHWRTCRCEAHQARRAAAWYRPAAGGGVNTYGFHAFIKRAGEGGPGGTPCAGSSRTSGCLHATCEQQVPWPAARRTQKQSRRRLQRAGGTSGQLTASWGIGRVEVAGLRALAYSLQLVILCLDRGMSGSLYLTADQYTSQKRF